MARNSGKCIALAVPLWLSSLRRPCVLEKVFTTSCRRTNHLGAKLGQPRENRCSLSAGR